MKIKNNIYIIGILLLLQIGLVNSTIENLGIYQQGKTIDLIQICGNCTFNNISSIVYPNSTIIVEDKNMSSKDTIRYNYTLDALSTGAIGTYTVNGFGDLDGKNTVWSYTFEVTRSGNELETGESIIYIIFLTAIIFTFCICLYGAVRIPFRNVVNDNGMVISVNDLKYLKVILIVGCYLLLLFIFGITKSILENYLFLNGAYRVFNWLYWIMFSFVWPGIVLTFVLLIVLFLESKKIKDAIERGVPLR